MRHLDVGLSQVLTSAAASIGITDFSDALGIGPSTMAVVCLVDGLGAQAIEDHADMFDSLADADGGVIEAAFPTTTPTGLATVGTGRNPGEHGIVGASFWLPDFGRMLSPLHWGRHPTPEAVQPEPTVFEMVEAAGVRTFTIAPAAYARSGLTRAALRGSRYLSAETRQERSERVVDVAGGSPSSLVYVYWADLDRAAHEFGCSSSQWRDAARDVNSLLWQLRRSLPPGGVLVVTADHGMVDCTDRVWLENEPLLGIGVEAVAGEPRMRHVYVAAGHDPDDVKNRWQEALGERAKVIARTEAIDTGLFGPCDPGLVERIGDVLAIARGGSILASRVVDERVSRLVGHHGALTEAERYVPGLVVRA